MHTMSSLLHMIITEQTNGKAFQAKYMYVFTIAWRIVDDKATGLSKSTHGGTHDFQGPKKRIQFSDLLVSSTKFVKLT